MTTNEAPAVLGRRRGNAILAWIIILAVCVFEVWWHTRPTEALPALAKPNIDAQHLNPQLLLVVFALAFTGFVGLCLLVLWGIFVVLGQLQLRLRAIPQHGAIYAETFAVWMLLFLGLGYAASWIPAGRSRLLLSGIATLLTLAALAWPMIRGVRWQRVRHDVGLHPGQNAVIEVVCGLGCYAAGLPLLFIGALVTIFLMALRKQLAPGVPETTPSHPAAEWIVNGDWWLRVQVLFLASVVAPLVEETMFRGVLYRHLREAGYRWGKVWSIAAATALTSFVFAVIHPQGWLGVPPLMALATAFTLTREWRGSLLPSMVAHSIQNSMTMILLLTIYD